MNIISKSSIPVSEIFPAYFPRELAKRTRLITLRSGETLFTYRDPIDALYRVVNGQISLLHHTSEGDEILLMRVGSGQFIAECSICTDIYTCQARASSDSLLARLPIADFDRHLYEDNSFARAWALDLAHRLKEQFVRYERISLRGARERILHYIYTESSNNGKLVLPGTYLELAEELNLTKETLYRTLATLEAEGTITREDHVIRITRPTMRM